ncbi:MAG: galactose oxidase-like domain-containing protein, partial [Verrucomicrobiota bacterium]
MKPTKLLSWAACILSAAAEFAVADGTESHAEMDGFMAEAVRLLPADVVGIGPFEARVITAADRKRYGTWGPVISWPHIPVTAANLPDGRIVTFSSNQPNRFPVGPERTYAAVYDPASGQITQINHNSHDMFCGHPGMLPDGKPFIAGGRNRVRFTSVFDWENDRWLRAENMNDGRWYPSSTVMPDGSMVTASGSAGSGINTVERWIPGQGWRRLTGVPWNSIPNKAFPTNFVAPNGKLFFAGPEGTFHWIDLSSANGDLQNTGVRLRQARTNQSGGAVMYDVGKILMAGGSTKRCEVIDINGATPTTTEVAQMKFQRKFHNALVLPTGEAIVIGGNTSNRAFSDQGSIMAAEMWNPNTNTWTELADMSVPRNYHSTALILPDGRVWSGGGGLSGNATTDHLDAQIFSPPYLYNAAGGLAPRPLITNSPDAVTPGRVADVTASNGIQRFTMIRMTSTTHAFTSDVRFLEVPFQNQGGGNYRLTFHANQNVIVPGYWMLFAIDSQGVPSVSKIIKVAIPSTPTIVNPGNQFTLLGNSVSFAVSASDFDGDALTFAASNLPNGLSITRDGVIAGTPAAAGTQRVTITVSDGQNSVDAAFNWTVSGSSGLIAHWSFDEIAGGPKRARFVRIQKSGSNLGGNALSLAEVRVFNTAGTNVALNRTTRQSSLGSGGLPARAVDGNTNGRYTNNSVSHTNVAGVSEWWEVDLGAVHSIDSIDLWNRTDCCSERLSNVWVMTAETAFPSAAATAQGLAQSRAHANFSEQLGNRQNVTRTILNPSESTTITDQSGVANASGVLQNGASLVSGLRGNAASFDGSNDVLTIGNKPVIEVGKNNADFSVSFWMNLRQGNTNAFRSLTHKGTTD